MENPSVPPRRTRWAIALGIIVLAAAAIVYVQQQEELTVGFRFMYSFLCVAVGYLLMLLWTLFFTGLYWRTRLLIVAVALAAPVTWFSLLRIEESIDGSGRPRFRWVWQQPAPPKDEGLSAAKPKTEPVDLKTTTPNDYPRFLGAQEQPIVHGILPAHDWSAQPPKKLWHQRIGVGWSAFAVVGPYAVTQEQIGDEELVICYEVETGKVRWTHADPVRFEDKQGGDGPRATPTIVGGRVYVMGATGILNCLDGATGEKAWAHDVLKENNQSNIIWGKSCSPLVVGDVVVVTGGKAGPTLLAFDKESGKEIWRTEEKDESSYASPALARNLAGRDQILITNATRMTAHDAKDGRLLWSHPSPGGMAVCAQPVLLPGDRVLMPGGAGGGCALLHVTENSDGTMSVSEVWRTNQMKPGFATMVVRGDYLYGLDDDTLACLDLKTGRRKWKERAGRYGWGQVLLAEDTLIVQADTGEVVLVEATPEKFHELARYPMLEGKTWTNPALSGNRLLVRNDRWAACYELPLRSTK